MEFLFDTCTWIKLNELQDNRIFDCTILYTYTKIAITHMILEEINYHNLSVCNTNYISIKPVGNEKIFYEAKEFELDDGDASLLSNGSKENDTIIISEDGGVLEFARAYRFVHMQLIDLFALLEKHNILTKKKLFQLTRTLRNMKNITKKKQKLIKKQLAEE
jgi:hypothetical protein